MPTFKSYHCTTCDWLGLRDTAVARCPYCRSMTWVELTKIEGLTALGHDIGKEIALMPHSAPLKKAIIRDIREAIEKGLRGA